MRIAILTHGVSPFGPLYARAFIAQGHEAEVLSLSACDAGGPGVKVRVVGPPGFKPWQDGSRAAYLKAVLPVRRAVREMKPDIVFGLYLSSGGLAACLSGHPHVVASAQGSDVNTRVGSRLWRAIFRWQGRRADLLHAVSVPLAETLEGVMGIARERIVVSPIGVDTGFLACVDPAARPGRGEILNTRAHWPAYDQPTAVRAMARLKQDGVACRLTFTCTRGAEATQKLVARMDLGDVIAFRPGYAYEELPAVMASADVYISVSLTDGTSQSLLEAMSTGLLPVVSDIPANRPWVEHGKNGLLFPPGDEAALAACVKEALARPEFRAAAAPLNRQIVVERGDVNREAGRLLERFERCLKGRPR
jgi:glycosyltransferase involved in cell wall biosynthesis